MKLYECDCHTHGFTVNGNEELGVIFMSFWAMGQAGNKLRWRDRLRWCWNILRSGEPYDDEVVLSPDGAMELASALAAGASRAQGPKTLGKPSLDDPQVE